MKLIDMTGRRFGRLVVVRKSPEPRKWLCKCDCGAEKLVAGSNLRNGSVRSCGCLAAEWSKSLGSNPEFIAMRSRPTKHGEASRNIGRTPEYRTWRGMRERCNRPSHKDYPNWGGRGITVCQRWDSFDLFLADMGRKPGPGFTIDRIDPDGNYCPENCRWVEHEKQAAEHSRNLRQITVHGTTFPSLAAAARHFGVPLTRAHNRLKAGDTPEQAFNPAKRSRWDHNKDPP